MLDSQAVKCTGLSTSANCPHFITTPGRAGSFAYHTHSLHPVPHSRVLTVKGTVNIFIVHNYSLCLSMPLISYVYKSLYLILWTLSRGPGRPPPSTCRFICKTLLYLWSLDNWQGYTYYFTWTNQIRYLPYSMLAFVHRQANHISLTKWLGKVVQWHPWEGRLNMAEEIQWDLVKSRLNMAG